MTDDVRQVLSGERQWCVVCADCLAVLPTLPAGSVNAVVTDPPYGCGKADWDDSFPVAWYEQAKRLGCPVLIITGSAGLKDTVPLVGEDFTDVISARNLNGMTRGPIGFGNWLAVVVANGKPSSGWNATSFAVHGDMPDHPSPKPIEFMLKIVQRCTNEGDLILDPFAGSGTTLVAAVQTGRRCIGVEINPAYCEIIRARVEKVASGGPLFKAEQPALFPPADAPEARP